MLFWRSVPLNPILDWISSHTADPKQQAAWILNDNVHFTLCDDASMLLTSPVVLKPNSKGQETAKARTHTVAIIMKTLLLERWEVLYKTGITTAVYLQTHQSLYWGCVYRGYIVTFEWRGKYWCREIIRRKKRAYMKKKKRFFGIPRNGLLTECG